MPSDRSASALAEQGVSVQDFLNDRIAPGDGLFWLNAVEWIVASSTALTTTRSAAGNVSLNRTAAGAETHYLVFPVHQFTRLISSKGLKLIDFVVCYSLGVVDATSVTPTVQLATYADRVAVSVASWGGSLTYDANHDSASERVASAGGSNPHLMTVTLGDQGHMNTDNSWMSIEIAFVLANTGTLAFYGGGLHFEHDYL